MPSGEPTPSPIVCVLRYGGQHIYSGEWGSLYLHEDEWHVYLPEDGGDPTMHRVLDDAVKRLVEAAYQAGRQWDPYDPPDADARAENDADRMAEMTPEELDGWGK